MIQLSNMITGSELTANDWNNHSKELENVVNFAGLNLSSNENDLTRAIDIFSKSNIYDSTNSGNDYTIVNRGLSVEELKSGIDINDFDELDSDIITFNRMKSYINDPIDKIANEIKKDLEKE